MKNEKFNRSRILPGALVLAIGLTGCSETVEDIPITGWAVGQTAAIMENDWVQYYEESALPRGGELRNIDQYLVKDGEMCVMYNSDGMCSISTPLYSTAYDFERYEPVVQKICEPNLHFSEFYNEDVQTNEDCKNNLQPGQWVIDHPSQNWIRVRLPSEDGLKVCTTELSKDQYDLTKDSRILASLTLRNECQISKVVVSE